MKKFKCYGCYYKSCYVEQDDDILTPCCCVHGWDGDVDWKEITEEENAKGVAITEDIVTVLENIKNDLDFLGQELAGNNQLFIIDVLIKLENVLEMLGKR